MAMRKMFLGTALALAMTIAAQPVLACDSGSVTVRASGTFKNENNEKKKTPR
jgi:hypothetical protein